MRKVFHFCFFIGAILSLLATVFFVADAEEPDLSTSTYRLVFSWTDNELTDIYSILSDGSNLTQFTKTDNMKNHYINPSWSPNGNRILFIKKYTKSFLRADDEHELWMVNSDGTELKQIYRSLDENVTPSWSPDGKKILFVVNDDNNKLIMIFDIDKNETQNLLETNIQNVDNRFITWTRDGRNVLVALEIDGKTDIYFLDINTKGLRKVTEKSGDYYEPSLSPDGSMIAFGCYGKLLFSSDSFGMMAADGSNFKLVAKYSRIMRISWSPDSSAVAFVQAKTNSYTYGTTKLYNIYYLCLYYPGEKKPITLTNMGYRMSIPSWSPDGKNLAITSSYSLLVYQSNVKKPLKFKIPYAVGNPSWSPDSKLIACLSSRSPSSNAVIYFASPEDMKIFKLNDYRNAATPSWDPHINSN